MRKDRQETHCPQCGKVMKLALNKAMRGRSFQCLDCADRDPLRDGEVSALLTAKALQPPKKW